MNKQTITCKKCGYIYWIDNVSWSVIPPDMNCPNCLPAASVNTSYSGRAINERSEESAVDKFLKGDGAIQAERTRIIKALEGLKKELGRGVDELGRPESPAVIIQIAERRGFNSALDQAIKAVEKGNK